jgi:hypothetical protein
MSNNFKVSKHLQTRCQQRGFRDDDLRLIAHEGTDARDGVVLLKKDAERAIRQRKKEIQQLERLAGVLIILDADSLTGKTIYRAGKRKIRYQTWK